MSYEQNLYNMLRKKELAAQKAQEELDRAAVPLPPAGLDLETLRFLKQHPNGSYALSDLKKSRLDYKLPSGRRESRRKKRR
jgi:hypothetical protein